MALTTPGRSPSFETIYRQFAPKVKALVARRIFEPGLAEDVVQETFRRAYEFGGIRDPEKHPWPWLSRIALRLCSSALRRRAERPFSGAAGAQSETYDLIESLVEPGPGPEDWAEARDQLRRAFGLLLPRHQRVLMERHFLGWRYDQVASKENLSVNAVAQLLFRARNEFKKVYAQLQALFWLPVARLITRMRSSAKRTIARAAAQLGTFLAAQASLWAQIREGVAAALIAALILPWAPLRGTTASYVSTSTIAAGEAKSASRGGVSAGSSTSSASKYAEVNIRSGQFVPRSFDEAASVGASTGVDKENITFYRKVEAKLPFGLTLHDERDAGIYCDSGSMVARAACDAVDAVPSSPTA